MENSNLYRLVRSFSAVEQREVRKFLLSPFFNQRQDLVTLFDCLVKGITLQKEQVWRHLAGHKPYDDQRMRLLMSYLNGLLEQYLAIREWSADPVRVQLHTAIAFRQRHMNESFERTRKSIEKTLAAQPLRNAAYYETIQRLQWEAHQVAYPQTPTDVTRLQELSGTTDVTYLAQKLQLICLLTAHQSVYHGGAGAEWEAEVIARAESAEYAGIPAITIYLHCYRMLRQSNGEIHFQQFKHMLLEQAACFSEAEMHGFYILAVNYCVRRLNAGDNRFYTEVLELYKAGLETGYLFEDGVLTRFTYHNIVAAGIHAGELDWVRFFINEYKSRLEKRYRESAFSFNLARLEYAQRNYGFVLELLQKANYRDPLINLTAKTLLLKTYYDLGELDLLQSHLDAMRNYIHRKRVLGYHRTNFLNIIRYMEKIIRLNAWDKASAESLRTALENEAVLTEKGFFLKILPVSQ